MASTFLPTGLGAEQIRVRQSSNNCTTSKEAGYEPRACCRAAFGNDVQTIGSGIYKTVKTGRKVFAKGQRTAAGRAESLYGGFGGGFWDGSDTDSSASERFVQKKVPKDKTAERSVLLSIIQEIEPLDMSLIGKDTSPAIMDAMKRTISGMLGLLPSGQFQVTVQTEREPLAKLLISGMMTGYTLRNAEYRLSLQKSLELAVDDVEEGDEKVGGAPGGPDTTLMQKRFDEFSLKEKPVIQDIVKLPEGLGELSPEAVKYIQSLQGKLAAASAELAETQKSYSALEMEMIGDDKNDLLDYLRSLEPNKVAELSKVASPEVEEVVQQVIDGLLGSLAPVHEPRPGSFNAALPGGITSAWTNEEGDAEAVTNIPLHFESTVTASRDYLARLLFWYASLSTVQGTTRTNPLSWGVMSNSPSPKVSPQRETLPPLV